MGVRVGGSQGAPTPADLAADLASLLRSGVKLTGLRGCGALLRLNLVAAKSASSEPDDLAAAADGLIREATRRVDDGEAYGPASVLLAVAPGTRGKLLKERRRLVAELLNVSFET